MSQLADTPEFTKKPVKIVTLCLYDKKRYNLYI